MIYLTMTGKDDFSILPQISISSTIPICVYAGVPIQLMHSKMISVQLPSKSPEHSPQSFTMTTPAFLLASHGEHIIHFAIGKR